MPLIFSKNLIRLRETYQAPSLYRAQGNAPEVT